MKSKLRYFIEFIILITVIIIALQFQYYLIPTKLGFFCHDQSLNYPLRSQTFTTLHLYIIIFIIPSFTIFVNEAIIFKRSDKLQTKEQIKKFFIYIYEIFYMLILIAFLCKIAVDYIKILTGRLRPHFIAVCAPINTTTGISFNEHCIDGQFIEDYICSNDDSNENYYSFVSGHSAFMTLSVMLTIVYIQYRVQWSSVGLIKNLYQIALFIFSCYVSLTRVSNYYHFPSDVIAGTFVGCIFVFISCFAIKEILIDEMRNFQRFNSSIEKPYEVTFSSSIQTVY